MSNQVSLGGYNLKELSVIILLFILGIAVAVFVAGLIIAISNTPDIVLKGEIDLSQFTGIIIGISMVAVTLVGQQLISKVQADTAKQTDQSWIDSDPDLKKG